MDIRQVKIYTDQTSTRLVYIADFIFGEVLGISFDIVSDRRKLGKSAVINYSHEKIPNSIRIEPSGLLTEQGIQTRDLIISDWRSLPVFFLTKGESDLPFDLFAAAFFMLSRYEEYLDHQPDVHGRFMAASSLAFRNGFLDKPVVDLWIREFTKILIRKFPAIAVKRNEYRAVLTVDSDEPFAYLGKNLLRSVGGLLKDFTASHGNASERYKVVRHEKKDPFEVFDYISHIAESNNTELRYFFPSGDHTKYDHNPSWKNEEYRELVRRLGRTFSIGLHPSYYSAENHEMIVEERKRLESMAGMKILASRFHFIRLKFPDAYRNLISAGISEDWSMGFPDEPGFRAGAARSFIFYDLGEERITSLRIFPFMLMDSCLHQYKKLSADESASIVSQLVEETRKAGGLFVSLWHNTSLLETAAWKPWRDLFENMMKPRVT